MNRYQRTRVARLRDQAEIGESSWVSSESRYSAPSSLGAAFGQLTRVSGAEGNDEGGGPGTEPRSAGALEGECAE